MTRCHGLSNCWQIWQKDLESVRDQNSCSELSPILLLHVFMLKQFFVPSELLNKKIVLILIIKKFVCVFILNFPCNKKSTSY